LHGVEEDEQPQCHQEHREKPLQQSFSSHGKLDAGSDRAGGLEGAWRRPLGLLEDQVHMARSWGKEDKSCFQQSGSKRNGVLLSPEEIQFNIF
jgi:hypothetical protein